MTTYDEYLEEVKRNHNLTAKSAIARLYELLKQEDSNLSKDDMYDRIVKDCLVIWQRSTIFNNMPDELKDPERQESGKKAKKKETITVTNDGSVAPDSVANSEENDAPSPKSPDWESEKKRIYKSNHKPIPKDLQPPILIDRQELESLRLENGKLKESLKEQKERFAELVKSTNLLAAQKKNISVIESVEYQALKSQLLIAEEERDEYKQVATKNIKANPSETFQSAAEIKQTSPSPQQTGTIEVEFPARELSTLFMDARIAKQVMYLKVVEGKVVGWESDAQRAKNQGRKEAQPA